MAHMLNMSETNHIWIKKNLVTLGTSGGRAHDIFRCDECGLEGKSYRIGVIEIDGRKKNPGTCKKSGIPTKIKVTTCRANGRAFANATPGSVHEIVDSPQPDRYPNGRDGVWIMGVGEPIRLLFGEYNEITEEKHED